MVAKNVRYPFGVFWKRYGSFGQLMISQHQSYETACRKCRRLNATDPLVNHSADLSACRQYIVMQWIDGIWFDKTPF